MDGAGTARSRAVRPLDVCQSDARIVHVVGRVPDNGPACPGNPDPHGAGHSDGRRQRSGAVGDGAEGIHHHRVRRTLLQGLSGAKGYANHTFNEVFVGGRWVRLNYKTLGQNTLDGNLMGLLTHVNTFNDLSEVPLAATWGKRYARASATRFSAMAIPIDARKSRTISASSPRSKTRKLREHRSLTISRAYWADDPEAHATIKESKWLSHTDGSRSLLIHGEEWFDDESGPQYRPFLEAAGKEFLFKADGHPDVHGRITTSSITWHSRNLHEIEVHHSARTNTPRWSPASSTR